MNDGDGRAQEVDLSSDSRGHVQPHSKGDDDDVIYVDLTRDPESQNWFGEPADKRDGFADRTEEEQESFQRRFRDKLAKLNR